jgi:hypothetical protein
MSNTIAMNRIFLLLLTVVTVNAFCQSPQDTRQTTIIFTNVNVVPMDSERVIENQEVVVKGGKIVSIKKASKGKPESNAMFIDGRGKYLLPGLAEMHAHVPPVDDIEPMKKVLLLFAVNGVTTIRGMLGHPRHLELRSKLQSGEILGPKFYTSGPSFNGQSVKSPEDAERMVKEQKAAGYDFLKIHPGITRENFDVLAKTARAEKIPFAGHVPFKVGIWHALTSGYSTIDHLDGFIEGLVPGIESIPENEVGLFGLYISDRIDTTQISKLVNGLVSNKVWVVPTQALAERWMSPVKDADAFAAEPEMKYMDANTISQWTGAKKNMMSNSKYDAAKVNEYIERRKRLILACQKGGVGLLSGSDAPQVFNVPGFAIHHELRYMVDAGLTPFEALQSSTVNVARYYNDMQNSGTLAAGKNADFIMISGNPLKDITNTSKVEGVMLGGKWLSKDFIDSTLRSLAR